MTVYQTASSSSWRLTTVSVLDEEAQQIDLAPGEIDRTAVNRPLGIFMLGLEFMSSDSRTSPSAGCSRYLTMIDTRSKSAVRRRPL